MAEKADSNGWRFFFRGWGGGVSVLASMWTTQYLCMRVLFVLASNGKQSTHFCSGFPFEHSARKVSACLFHSTFQRITCKYRSIAPTTTERTLLPKINESKKIYRKRKQWKWILFSVRSVATGKAHTHTHSGSTHELWSIFAIQMLGEQNTKSTWSHADGPAPLNQWPNPSHTLQINHNLSFSALTKLVWIVRFRASYPLSPNTFWTHSQCVSELFVFIILLYYYDSWVYHKIIDGIVPHKPPPPRCQPIQLQLCRTNKFRCKWL